MGSVGPDSLINQIRCGNRFNKDNPCPKSMCLAQFPGWCRGCGEPIDVNDILVDSDFREDPVFGVYNATIPAPFSLTDPPRAEAKKVWGHLDCTKKTLLQQMYKCLCCKELIKHFEKRQPTELTGNFGNVIKGWRHISCPSFTGSRPLKRNINDLLPKITHKMFQDVEGVPEFQTKISKVTQVDGPSILNMPFQETKEYMDDLEVQEHLAHNETPPLKKFRDTADIDSDDEKKTKSVIL